MECVRRSLLASCKTCFLKKIVQGLGNEKNVTLSTDDALACGGVASVDARRGPPKGTPPLDLPVAVINS